MADAAEPTAWDTVGTAAGTGTCRPPAEADACATVEACRGMEACRGTEPTCPTAVESCPTADEGGGTADPTCPTVARKISEMVVSVKGGRGVVNRQPARQHEEFAAACVAPRFQQVAS